MGGATSRSLVTATFEKDKGFRFTRGGISILVHAAAEAKPGVSFTVAEINDLFSVLSDYIGRVSEECQSSTPRFGPLQRPTDFNSVGDRPMYKFMSRETVERWLKGSLQLGSVNYYRTAEDSRIRDNMEGRSCLIIDGPRVQTALMAQSGYNFAILCGTSSDRIHSDVMRSRYGDVIVRIKSIRAFGQHVGRVIGARRLYFNNVRYNDLKLFRARTLIRRLLASDTFHEHAFGAKAFSLLYRMTFLPSLFMKPSGFADDEELRLAFEMDQDIAQHIRVQVPNLRDFFEVVA